ncbi:MAG: V-type ATP synthase subunit I [Thermoplasmatota archaeon]
MALRPEPMVRTVIVAPRAYESAVVEALHTAGAAHFVDYTETREGEFTDFKIGRPLTSATTHSEKLVRLRSMLRHLGLEGAQASRTFSVREVEADLASTLFQVEQDVTNAAESKARLEGEMEKLREERARLAPLVSLPLNVEDFSGYDSLAVFVGTTVEPLDAAAVSRAAPDAELFTGEHGVFALFAPKDRAQVVADVLFKLGYREQAVPSGAGAISARLAEVERNLADLAGRLAGSESKLAELRGKYGDFLLAAEEHLAIEVAKAEAPLSFATTENAFVVDAWIPESDVENVRAKVNAAAEGNVFIETQAPMHEGHERSDTASNEHAEQHGSEPVKAVEPPTRMNNGGYAHPFQFFTEMFSTPKWSEIDPTWILAVCFPLFFGFMIGDLGYGALMALLGGLIAVKLKRVDGARQLGVALLVSGLVAMAFGGLVFQDAFGIQFGAAPNAVEELNAAHLPLTCASMGAQLHETTWTCLATGDLYLTTPFVQKLVEVGDLLMLSIWAAFFQLGLGLVFGIINEGRHSRKHALAKTSWLALMVGFFLLIASQPAIQGLSPRVAAPTAAVLAPLLGSYVIIGLLVLGIIGLIVFEGPISILEVPSMLSNILSYTRLAGVAVAKGAMAVAFNSLTLVGMVQSGAGIGLVIVGLILLVVTQLLVFMLGIISSGIQAIRLNYVEFFTKFYKGGGEKFEPFGGKRKFTTTSN